MSRPRAKLLERVARHVLRKHYPVARRRMAEDFSIIEREVGLRIAICSAVREEYRRASAMSRSAIEAAYPARERAR